jgi:hypothetical protein
MHLNQEFLLDRLRPAFKLLGAWVSVWSSNGESDYCCRVNGGLVELGMHVADMLHPIFSDRRTPFLPARSAADGERLARKLRMDLPAPMSPTRPLTKAELRIRHRRNMRGRGPL